MYATVAFGERWMYRHLWACQAPMESGPLLFIVFGGLALKPLVVQPKAKRTFWRWFVWLSLPTRRLDGILLHTASLLPENGWARWLGSAALGLVVAVAFGARSRYPRIAVELFVAHSAGYFLGEWLHPSLHGKIGMLLWGVCYGLGFGLGLARALYWAQTADTPSSLQRAG